MTGMAASCHACFALYAAWIAFFVPLDYDRFEVKNMMDYQKIGLLIRKLRTDKSLTQAELAEMLHVSNKTVSKWECGNGCPEISMFPALSKVLGVDFAALFSGETAEKSVDSGNLRKLKFYICPNCGNLITSTSDAAISCCGKVLLPQKAQRAGEEIRVTLADRECQISSDHEMSRQHYITFLALCSSEQILLRKLYPEWNLELYMPYIPGAMLIWHCSQHGLFYQPLPQYRRTPHSEN